MSTNRIKDLYETLGETQTSFAQEIGYDQSSISHHIRGASKKFSKKLVDTICKKYPHVNRHWLETGEGEMFLCLVGDSPEPTRTDNLEPVSPTNEPDLAKIHNDYVSLLSIEKRMVRKLIDIFIGPRRDTEVAVIQNINQFHEIVTSVKIPREDDIILDEDFKHKCDDRSPPDTHKASGDHG